MNLGDLKRKNALGYSNYEWHNKWGQVPTLDFAMKFLLPVAILTNIVGIILGIIQFGKVKNRKILKIGVICLNAIPLIGVVCFFLWLFLGFKI
jgi:ABC-type sugar transport system permease subunit